MQCSHDEGRMLSILLFHIQRYDVCLEFSVLFVLWLRRCDDVRMGHLSQEESLAFLILLDVEAAQEHDGFFSEDTTIYCVRWIHAGTLYVVSS